MVNLPFWKALLFDNPLVDLADILVVALVLYQGFLLIEGTRAEVLIKGIAVLLVVMVLSGPLGLNEINWLLEAVLPWGFLALVVIFQQELRRGLERLGSGLYLRQFTATTEETFEKEISALLNCLETMKQRRIGALIVFEATVGLREHYENVARINAEISEELILTIFFKDTLLHDGAMIIKGNKIICASVWLPLSQNQSVDKNFGTRHRAGLGIVEVSDALVLIVSEERGEVSIAQNGQIRRDVHRQAIEEELKKYFKLAQWHQQREKELKEDYT